MNFLQILCMLLSLVTLEASKDSSNPKTRILKAGQHNFLRLLDQVFTINHTYKLSPDPDSLSFKLDAVHAIKLRDCRNYFVANQNCPRKGSVKINCRFFSRIFFAELIQLYPVQIDKNKIMVENREGIQYHYIEGSFDGAMTECCQANLSGQPIVFPYVHSVRFDNVSRCVMTQDPITQLPENISQNELNDFLLGFLNTYFHKYLTEHLYAPAC